MKRITLTQGQFAIVDDEDYKRLNQVKWHARWSPGTQSFYAQRTNVDGGGRVVNYMHREVLGLAPGAMEVDHENHDTLDNRRQNLKAVTSRENSENRRTQSKYGPGVYKRASGRFQAQTWFDGKIRHIGMFDTFGEAGKARIAYLKERLA